MPNDTPTPDFHGPQDAAHKAVHEATEHLMGGRVTSPKARAGLRKALDKADAPLTGRPASDGALGRAIRMAFRG